MAEWKVGTTRAAARMGLSVVLAVFAAGAYAEERQPHEVIVTPDRVDQRAMNEDGIVEANAARIEHGVVHLEFIPAGAAAEALAAAPR